MLLIFLNVAASIFDIACIAFLFVVINFYSPQGIADDNMVLPGWLFIQHSFVPAIVLAIVFLGKSFFGYYVYKLHYRFVNNVASALSSENIMRYLEGPFSAYVDTDSALFIRKISFYPIEFAHFILSGFLQMAAEIILIFLTILALLFYDAKLLLIVSAVLIPAILVLSYITKRRLSGLRKDISAANEHNMQFMQEALGGYVESNIYGANKSFARRYASVQARVNNYVADLQITQGMPSRFFESFAVMGLVLLVVLGLYGATENVTGILTLGAYMAAAYKIIPGISKIINFNSSVKTYAYAMDDLIKTQQEERKHNKPPVVAALNSIRLSNISFSFKGHAVCSNFSYGFNSGSFTAIKGVSGRGKTTLVNLILGFLNPDKGVVFFNEVATDPETRKSYWPEIAYVKQEPFMLHDSIVQNIVLLEENYDQPRLDEAVAGSGLLPLINEYPEGLLKVITENGKNISGGQRQRIAIARALYRNASVIILDEPFNELDEAGELQLMQNFQILARSGKIIILITHNSNHLQFCTHIISLDEA